VKAVGRGVAFCFLVVVVFAGALKMGMSFVFWWLVVVRGWRLAVADGIEEAGKAATVTWSQASRRVLPFVVSL
jgi:hypothetical protein